jgi:hypothetical protein
MATTIIQHQRQSTSWRHVPWRTLLLATGVGLAVGVCFSIPAHSQQAQMQNSGPSAYGMGQSTIPKILRDPSSTESRFQAERIVAMNMDRQKAMIADANKLLKLTAELNAQVDQAKSSALTPDQLRMLAKIEKLAKNVKNKMSYPIEPANFQGLFPPLNMSADMAPGWP